MRRSKQKRKGKRRRKTKLLRDRELNHGTYRIADLTLSIKFLFVTSCAIVFLSQVTNSTVQFVIYNIHCHLVMFKIYLHL